jgi:hypothetical protein
MPSFPALDVALGLFFVYFVLALVCSALNEVIATAAGWRSTDLERGLRNLFKDPKALKKFEALEAFEKHPLVKGLFDPRRADKAAKAAKSSGRRFLHQKILRGQFPPSRYPSYIPSRTFATAVLGFASEAIKDEKGKDVKQQLRKLDESIAAIPSEPVREALTSLLHHAQGDAVVFRQSVEQWYDDAMERVSGWYRRRVQKVLWVLAFLVAFAINADTLQIGKRLWVDPATRTALANKAAAATGPTGTTGATGSTGSKSKTEEDPVKELRDLPVPLGWHLASARHDPQGFPFYEKWSTFWSLLSKLLGLSLTAVALSLGAPFWFDTLSKLARLRNSGAPPPASDATRRGEGEETRKGPNLIIQATPEPEETEPEEGAEGGGTATISPNP